MKRPLGQLAASIAAAIAAPVVVVGLSVLVFFNPAWLSFEQGRSNVTAWTGWTQAQVDQVTGAILSDLVFGPPEFDVTLDGQPVLDERERGHMRDVRAVFAGFGLVALVAAAVLVSIGLAARRRAWLWRSIAAGTTVLIGGIVAAGIGVLLFFDLLFEAFHQLFFPAGTYMFDPRTSRLVQLLPDQLWTETTMALGVVIVIVALLARRVALGLVERCERSAGTKGGAA